MLDTNVLKLYAPSRRFLNDFLTGVVAGRKLDLWDISRVWFHHFYTIATNLFEYRGLDEYLQKQIEKRLFYDGVCGIIKDDNNGLVAVTANGNGENIYADPTHFTFSFGNGENDKKQYARTINENGVFARNTFDYYPTFYDVEKMSFTMAHIDTSINCEVVNMRLVDVFIAGNNASAESATEFYNRIYKGKLAAITDKTQELEMQRQTRANSYLKELYDAKERELKNCYEAFGIRKQGEKRERMITDEIAANKELLHFNLKDMLNARKEMCKNISNVFGVSCSVVSHVDIDGDGENENEKEMQEAEKGVKENDL